ncbi:MAG: hypothetical protein JO340_02415 [Acidobacteriaceae bacterium]|nr:hypothetical protein [Acidobacteriaceae bacterium]
MHTGILPALAFAAIAAGAAWSFSDPRNAAPSEWTGPEVFQILNNSPWSKTVKVNVPGVSPDALGNQNTANTSSNAGALPPGAGGVGRRSMGGRGQTTYNSSGRSNGGSSSAPRSGPTEVTIQWQSALVVRMAAAKKAGDPVDPAAFKPLDEYVIAVIGLPITAVGGPAASAESNNTLSAEEEQRVEDNVKSSTGLLRSGHEPLRPVKIELDQGKDGRMLIHFPKSDPIQASDKTVEFRLAMGHTELRGKFPLKEMEYQGKLEL